MKKTFNIILLAAALAVTGCQDWTTPEAIPVKVDTIEETNPGLFARYTEAIRAYKASEHRVTYVAYDNIYDQPVNTISRISNIPDSTDFIELTNPLYNGWTGEDMKAMRKNFGTKFILRISFKKISEAAIAEFGEADYLGHVTAAVDELLLTADKYGYDGITVEYEGQGTLHALDSEIKILQDREAKFFTPIKEWKGRHADKMMFFEGNPQHTVDHSVVLDADYVILPTADEKSAQKCGFMAFQALQYEDATGKTPFTDLNLIFAARAIPDDITDSSTGRYFEGPAIGILSRWIAGDAPEECSGAGIAVYNVQDDCLGGSIFYPNLRSAIKVLNPNI